MTWKGHCNIMKDVSGKVKIGKGVGPMKGAMTAAAMHKQYSDGVAAFRQHIANPAMRQKFNADADEFMRLCALGVWQADGGNVTPQHVEYYNAIYCKGNPAPAALFWELSTAVADYSGFEAPGFFQKMREYDKAYGQKTSRRFVDLLTLMRSCSRQWTAR